MKKKLVAVIATTAIALTVSAGSIASADNGKGGAGFSTFLSELVTKGTITQQQADAIAKALADKKALAEANRPTQAEMQAHRAAEIAVITSTLGINEATLTSRIKAGESLATIAGSKKDALITALVAFENKEIDAKVAAGKLTAAQATQIKANVTNHVTEEVNEVRGSGKMDRGHGDKGSAGELVVPGPTAGAAKFSAKTAIKAVKA